jgi:2,4-dienoyl-CoA reductase-like NADH-dependent reductase (Old Yellow Enzyme family)
VLFEPLTIKSLRLPNRVVMAPMTRYFSPGGVPTADVAAYYRRRAAGGAGLLFSEGTGIARPWALYDHAVPQFHGERALSGWRGVIDAVHAAGGRMGPQLWHVGAMTDADRVCEWPGKLESPSGLERAGKSVGVTMTERDIADTIDAFARAAADAKRLGFDCLEIHGAHSYLIDQFFWAATNQRTDRYGGASLAQRARFAAEVVRAVRRSIGEDFVISLRVSQWKQQDYSVRMALTPAEMEAWLTPLADAGVDLFHCSQRRFWEPEFDGSDLNFAGWAKKLTGRHTITVGSVGDADTIGRLLERLDRSEFDLVAVGRALLSDPDWAEKIRTGRAAELRAFTPELLGALA